MGDINSYFEIYERLKNGIDEIDSILESAQTIKDLDVTSSISDCVKIFKDMKDVNRINLKDDLIKEIDKKNDEIKAKIIKLKNKQIYYYNLYVQRINEKINVLKSLSSIGIVEDVKTLEELKLCNVYISNDWQKSNYKNKLHYDKALEMFEKISKIEVKYGVEENEPLDLNVRLNYFTKSLDDVKKQIREDMPLDEVKELLDRCSDIYGNLIALDIDISMYFKNVNSIESFDNYRDKTVKLISLSNDVMDNISHLLLIKKDNDERSNDYTVILDRIQVVEGQIKRLSEKILEYYGKCDESVLDKFKVHLGNIRLSLTHIQDASELIDLNREQKRRLYDKGGKFEYLEKLLNDIEDKIKNDPFILGENFDSYVNRCMKDLETDIIEFNNLIDSLEKTIKDKSIFNHVNMLVEKIKNNISHIDTLLSKAGNIDLKNKLNANEEIFNRACKKYNGKRPLLVEKVKPANSVYKKYKKECLQVSGLSSLSLLDSNVLVPTIMHGNIVLGQKVPLLKDFLNFSNNILGGVINAKRDINGEWMLSNGYKIGPTVACTSILKSMALSGSNLVSSPLIQKVKNLMTKIQLKENNNEFEVSAKKKKGGR